MGRKTKHTDSDDDTFTSSGDEQESDGSECSETDYDTESDTEDKMDPWANRESSPKEFNRI